MNLDINLERRLSVSCWRVVGQVARSSKREELMPMLLRIGDQGESNAKDIASHLFFEPRSRRVVAERLLQIARSYKLLDENHGWFSLTDEGRAAIESEHVFVPEHGTWTVWASDDPLVGPRILRVDPWQEPSAYDEVWGSDRYAERSFQSLPEWLAKLVGDVQEPCAGDKRRLRIDALEDEGELVSANAELTVAWAVGAGKLSVGGTLERMDVDMDLDPPARTSGQVWRDLLKSQGLWAYWNSRKEVLLVGFDDTSETERESMTRTLSIARPSLEGLGVFDPIDVHGLRLATESLPDACRWATWRLQSRIQDYATHRRMEEWRRAALEPFAEQSITLPTRAELAHEAWSGRGVRPSPRTWHLIAAEDWRLG